MIHPANNKVLALSVIAGQSLTQGELLKFYVASGSLTMPNAASVLNAANATSLLATAGNISVNAGLVVQNDIATVVVLLGAGKGQ